MLLTVQAIYRAFYWCLWAEWRKGDGSPGYYLRGSLISPSTLIPCTSDLLPTSLPSILLTSTCIDSCFSLSIFCRCLLPSPLSPADLLLFTSSSPHFPSSRRAFLLMSTSITFTPPRSLNLLYPHLSPSSSLVFSRCFHSFRKFSPSYALICSCIKEALTLLICREQNHFKLFSKFLTAGALTGAQALKWST